MSVTRVDISSYFSPLSIYYRDNYIAPDISDFRSTSDDSGSAAFLNYRQDRGNKESTEPGSHFLPLL